MTVLVIDDKAGIPEGSRFKVHEELKHTYTGIWSSSCGSIKVKVLKKYCKIENEIK